MSTDVWTVIDDLLTAHTAYCEAKRACQAQAGELLLAVRHAFGWTQRDVATLLAYDTSYISKIENGRLRAGVPLLVKLAAIVRDERQRRSTRSPGTPELQC